MMSALYGDEDDVLAVLLSQVEDTFSDCLGITHAIVAFNDGFFENRRRVDGVATDVEETLKVCDAMMKVANTFYRNQGIWSKGIFGVLQQSEISFVTDLLEGVGKKIGEALFVASVDGDAASKFHSLCDDQGATLVVVETTSGVIFGGYTDMSWSPNQGQSYVESTTVFLFQVRPAMIKFGIEHTQYAIFQDATGGPSFGRGHDLDISSGAMSNTASSVYGSSYAYTTSNKYELNNGERYFQVKDYVVLKAVSL